MKMKETRKYKHMELGLLPEDWEVAKLGDIGYLLKGNGISKSQANSGDLCAVRYGELYTLHHNYIKTYNSHISKEVALFATKIQKGDILFACSGETKEEIGKCAAFVDEVEAYAGGDILILRTDQEKCSDIFLGFLLNMPIAANQKAAKGQGDAVVHISKASLENLSIPLPPIEEQRRIASALTSIDNLIDSLDRLIAKKKDIKQGAMQQLLSGKKRLKGFTEPWVEKRLGNIVDIKRGVRVVKGELTEDGLFPVFQNTNKPLGYFNRNNVKAGTPYVIIGGSAGQIGICERDYWAADDCAYFDCGDTISNKFLYFLLLFHEREIHSNVRSASVPRLDRKALVDLFVYFPSLPEQQAIASVLTSMDNELSALEAKRKKYEQIKQGMMQQLLTGRIRLI